MSLLPVVCTRPCTNVNITCSEPVRFYTQWRTTHSFYLLAEPLSPCLDRALTVYIDEVPYRLDMGPRSVTCALVERDTPLTYTHQSFCFLEPTGEGTKGPNVLYLLDGFDAPFLERITALSETHKQYVLDTVDQELIRGTPYEALLGACIVEEVVSEPPTTLLPVLAKDVPKDHLLIYDPDLTLEFCQKADAAPHHWDAIALLTTLRELEPDLSGQCRGEVFLRRLLDSFETSVDKSFYLCVNRGPIPDPIQALLEQLKPLVRSVEVLDLAIPVEDDVYGPPPPGSSVPKGGNVSGPNLLFLGTARALAQKHTTALFLETDCFLKKGWIQTLDGYVQHAGKFLIAGAKYDGSFMCLDIPFLNHLNGVAFYKVGSPVFQRVLDHVQTNIERQVQQGDFCHAYDMAIGACIYAYLTYYMKDASLYSTQPVYCNFFCFWRYVNRMLVSTTHIVNASIKADQNLTLPFLESLYDGVIVHRKG